jgi:putative NIF3 family GTP cyclohydrolase 1 type 2
VGRLAEPLTAAALADRVAAALPSTPAGLRVAGDLHATVTTVAVAGGAGDGLFDAVRGAGAEAYVTADLRHHPASEERARDSVTLIDVGHWASEWPWLGDAAARLSALLEERGTTVETQVSRIVTDPWTAHVPMTGGPT